MPVSSRTFRKISAFVGLKRIRHQFDRSGDIIVGEFRIFIINRERGGEVTGMTDEIPVVVPVHPPRILVICFEPLFDQGPSDCLPF